MVLRCPTGHTELFTQITKRGRAHENERCASMRAHLAFWLCSAAHHDPFHRCALQPWPLMRRTRVLAFAVLGGVGAKSRSVVGEADSDKTKAKWAQPRQHRSDLRPWPRTVPLCVANSPARGTESSQQRAAIQNEAETRQRNASEKTRAGISRLCERPIPMNHHPSDPAST